MVHARARTREQVCNFNRLPSFVVDVAVRLLGVVCEYYFDDHVVVDPDFAMDSGNRALTFLYKLLGLDFEEEKYIAGGQQNPFMGRIADLSCIAERGVVRSLPKEGRAARINELFAQGQRENYFPPGLAATTRGKLGFTLTSAYSRVGRAPTQVRQLRWPHG